MTTRRQHIEDDFQEQVCRFLDHALPRGCEYWAVPNGGFRNRAEAQRLKKQGVKTGVPDLTVLSWGRYIGLELKAPKGRASDAQLYMHRKLREAEARVYVCKNLDDVIAALTECGVPLRARVAA
jgi:hypothetical protein